MFSSWQRIVRTTSRDWIESEENDEGSGNHVKWEIGIETRGVSPRKELLIQSLP